MQTTLPRYVAYIKDMNIKSGMFSTLKDNRVWVLMEQGNIFIYLSPLRQKFKKILENSDIRHSMVDYSLLLRITFKNTKI